jgi:hypothetical protein
MRQKKKADRESQLITGGKKSAFRSEKPAMKKKDNGPAKEDEETVDQRRYLGMKLGEAPPQAKK